MLQDHVAGLMPMGVVDLLEVIQVRHHHRDGLSAAACARRLLRQPLVQIAAVEDSEQGIGHRQLMIDPQKRLSPDGRLWATLAARTSFTDLQCRSYSRRGFLTS